MTRDNRFAWHDLPGWARKLYQEWRISQSGPGFGQDAYYWYLQDIGHEVIVNPRNAGFRQMAMADFRRQAPSTVVRYLRRGIRR